ncbi:MAG TPA: bifunctional transaldolase/phosoglucose isomerase [Thermoanaerobaculia bacterium]|nr:bifunctional transaldolase/phosoglucose isomerase [Thermoanaerobaculia bacterium]
MSNPLVELGKLGQSVWYDQMERKLVTSGKLREMIESDDLRGLTSNPTIFEKAIAGSEDYDGQIRMLASQNRTADDIYDELTIDDIGAAADVFRPVYERTHGNDGFCSLEVSPLLAPHTQETIAEAKHLFERLGRPNVMIKIPATGEGIPAIEESIFNGLNINVTLIFSLDVYRKVMEAYIRGLERRVEKGLPVGDINSVASFFVSRIDTAADKQIEARISETTSDSEKRELQWLLGKVAVANAKVAYQEFKKVFGSERFRSLAAKGAKVQRPLWASTGTKNPKYSDVLYVETLIGPDTVNTLPPATYEAFRDHGKVMPTLEENLDESRRVLETFAAKGFRLGQITDKLTSDGVKSFNDSFISLMATIEARRDDVARGLSHRLALHLGALQPAIEQAVHDAEKQKVVERIWARDATLWKSDESHRRIIENALGWINVPERMVRDAGRITAFAESVRRDFDDVVVLGMGGSSLCSEVIRRLFGRREGYPALSILDSTLPEAVRNLESRLDLARTLFIVGSKSGTTTEPVVFHRYFFERVKSVKGGHAGENFVAITDPGTQLQKDAERDHFRETFLNMADIGGRYSALSYFGMVPAAVSGVDIATLLDRADHATHVAGVARVKKNAPALLGVVLGAMAKQGRDKLTLITPPPLDTLGLWIEQLIAESTGKEGMGIVPVSGEPPLAAKDYGSDRLFVSVRLRGSDDTARLRELTEGGHPVIDFVLEDPLDLGETFYLWEFATAVAGALMGIDPFDQPNVQESKDNTRRLLEEYRTSGRFAEAEAVRIGENGAADRIASLLSSVRPGDYVALTEYFAESAGRDRLIAAIRQTIARELRVATTTGYGPRFLHSTGQLHKGGAGNGVFLQLLADDPYDVPIPGEPYTFGVLARAQAEGDFESLARRGRRAIRVHLGADVEQGLQALHEVVKNAVARVGGS